MSLIGKSLIVLLIIKIIFIQSNEIVILSLNSSYKSDLYNELSFIDNIQERILYSKIKIGEPLFEIKTLITVKDPYFSLTPNKFNNIIYNSNLNYNFTNSQTFKNITCLNEYLLESRNDIIAEERFKLNIFNYKKNTNTEIFLNNMNFVLGITDNYKEKIYNLNIGLRILTENTNRANQNYSFIYQLKEKKIINNYYWYIFFDKGDNKNGKFLYNADKLFNASGILILGDSPSDVQPNKFHKSQFLTSYSYAKDLVNTWAIEFNSIYHYNKNNKTVKDTYYKVHIDINNYLIQAPNSYYYHIKINFFNEYLSKGICHIYTGNGFEAIYCDKSENFTIYNLQKFPILYLQNNELQYIFEFNYEDLFVEIDDKIWFLIIFPIYYEIEEWFFGIIFLRKYNLIFNQDSKTISFYNPNLPLEEEENISSKSLNKYNDNKLIIFIVIIVILGFLFFGLGLYLGKIVYNHIGKRRFNELDDSFEYVSNNQKLDNNESNFIGV